MPISWDANWPKSAGDSITKDNINEIKSNIDTVNSEKQPIADTVDVTASRTLAISDNFKLLNVNSSSAVVVTIPADATEDIPIGAEIAFFRYGSGALSIAPASGVTLQSDRSRRNIKEQYSGGAIKKIAANTWILAGNLGE